MGFLHGIRKWVIPSFLWKFARKAFLLLYENVTINGPLHVQSHILLHLRRWRMNEGNAWKRPFVEIFRSRTLSTFNVHVTWMEPEYLSRISKLFYPSTHILAKSTSNFDNSNIHRAYYKSWNSRYFRNQFNLGTCSNSFFCRIGPTTLFPILWDIYSSEVNTRNGIGLLMTVQITFIVMQFSVPVSLFWF